MYPLAVRATERLARVLTVFPHAGGRLGPPRHVVNDVAAFARLPGVEMRHVAPSVSGHHVLPSSDGPPVSEFTAHAAYELPPVYLLTIDSGSVLGVDAAVIGPHDTFFAGVANRVTTHRASYPALRRLWRPSARRVSGRVVVIATAYADFYYHWLTEALARCWVLGDELGDADAVVAPASKPFQAESLDRLGVRRDQILAPGPGAYYQADRLIVPSLVGNMTQVRREAIRFVRRLFDVPDGARVGDGGRRLYVSRQDDDRRRIRNEDEVLEVLGALGFEVLHPGRHSIADQARLFSEAELVVGPHGGGLTNVLFCPTGATVVELFAPDNLRACFWTLASNARLSYHYLVGRRSTSDGWLPSLWSDIDVDCDELARVLDPWG